MKLLFKLWLSVLITIQLNCIILAYGEVPTKSISTVTGWNGLYWGINEKDALTLYPEGTTTNPNNHSHNISIVLNDKQWMQNRWRIHLYFSDHKLCKITFVPMFRPSLQFVRSIASDFHRIYGGLATETGNAQSTTVIYSAGSTPRLFLWYLVKRDVATLLIDMTNVIPPQMKLNR
jgi:hypothetical protein